MRIRFLTLVLLAIPFLAWAQEESHPIDVAMEKAMDKDPSTAGQTQAIDAALKKWDGDLNKHYKKLTQTLDPAAVTKLRESQRAWLSWRDLEIESIRAFHSKMEGTMWVPIAAYSVMNLTRNRAMTLMRLAELSENRSE